MKLTLRAGSSVYEHRDRPDEHVLAEPGQRIQRQGGGLQVPPYQAFVEGGFQNQRWLLVLAPGRHFGLL